MAAVLRIPTFSGRDKGFVDAVGLEPTTFAL